MLSWLTARSVALALPQEFSVMPSTVKLFSVPRFPWTYMFHDRVRVSALPASVSTTPGTSCARDITFRLLVKRSEIWWEVTTPERSLLEVCSTEPCAVTVIFSSTEPTASTSVPADSVSDALSIRSFRSIFLNPDASAVSMYPPGTRLLKTKSPRTSVRVWRSAPVVTWRNTMDTPDTGNSLGSTTEPTIEPVIVWAFRDVNRPKPPNRTARTEQKFLNICIALLAFVQNVPLDHSPAALFIM